MTKCDPITRAQCPHAAYCEPFAVYTDESECAKFAKRVLNKPVTNADRIRAMSDKELALFLSERYANESILRVREQGYEPTATQIKALNEGLYRTWMRWLTQQVEENDNWQAKKVMAKRQKFQRSDIPTKLLEE